MKKIFLTNHSFRFSFAVLKDASLISSCALVFSLNIHSQNFQEISQSVGLSGFCSGQYGNGVSFYDWNWDGYDDIVLCNDNSVPQFFQNNNGTFEEVNLPGIDMPGNFKSVNWVDYDNDGDADLALNRTDGAFVLYRNEGDFSFTNVSWSCGISQANSQGYGQSWGDYNNDGFIDVYLCNYQGEWILPLRTNYLYKNNGDGTFTDVTSSTGVGNGYKTTFISVWLDYDKDGWQDLFVFNDRFQYHNYIYRNNQDGTFSDVSNEMAFDQYYEPMSATIGDFNNDGWMDIYSTNGNGNKLYQGSAQGIFTEVASVEGVQLMAFSWGAVWLDGNGDQKLDLVVATSDSYFSDYSLFYFRNSGSSFSIYQDGDLVNFSGQTYSMAKGDYNNDGRPDLLSHSFEEMGTRLWQLAEVDYNTLKIALQGEISNRDGIGAWIEVYTEGFCQTSYTLNGEQYLSQNSQWNMLSLNQYTQADSLIIRWPSGIIDKFYQLQANQTLIIKEGSSFVLNISQTPIINACIGDSVLLDAGTADSYLWNNGDTTQYFNVVESGQYYVSVQNNQLIYHSDTVSISFNEPTEYLVVTSDPQCFNDFTSSIQIANPEGFPIDSVLWNDNFFSTVLENVNTEVVTFTFEDQSGCFIQGYLDISYPDQINFSIETELSSTNSPCSSMWMGSTFPSGGLPPYEILCEFYRIGEMDAFQSSSGLAFECVNANEAIQLVCTVKDANDCIEINEHFLPSSLSTSTLIGHQNFLMFPNPFNSVLNFEPQNENFELDFYDSQFRLIATYQIAALQNQIDLSELETGLYFIKTNFDHSLALITALKK
ncbi:MAG: FG-GAP-like repeat-containing protein [Bacteroidia bacterium]